MNINILFAVNFSTPKENSLILVDQRFSQLNFIQYLTNRELPKDILKDTILDSTKFNTADYIYFPISKTNSLGDKSPNDLVKVSPEYTIRDIYVSKLIISDLQNLIDAASRDGITLKIVSGYRSYTEQSTLFNYYLQLERSKSPNLSNSELEKIVNTYSAKPGHSEHQLGTTVDVLSAENNYQFDSNEKLKYVQWIEKNSVRFNFIISYPKGNSEYIYEPWHIRWRK